ncbi:MAG: Tetratricopeptide 2 repeat protein [Myxococcales bacterium]|nr:Tetratricopeptide 2 repeat protein [Myxococcales bacterium]
MTRGSMMFAVLLAAGSAHAQQPAPNAAADAALSEGRRLYDLQEWDQAIGKFKEAYRLRADAPALFNIAQSYRLKGDCTNAASFYKTFKRNFPKERNIDKVDKFIAEMVTCAATGPVKTEPVKTEPVKTEPVKTEPVKTEPVKTEPVKIEPVKTAPDPIPGPVIGTDEPGKRGGGLKIAGIAVGGVGLIAVGAGVVFGLRASSAAGDAEKLPPGSVWEPGIEDRGEKASKNAKLFFAIGGAAVITGGVLYFLGAKKSSESSSVALIPTHDGASLTWASEF